MSEPYDRRASANERNRATSLGGSRLARAVHGVGRRVHTTLLTTIAALGGCVIPPSLSVDNQDAGVNSPPAILAVRSDDQELPEPGPVRLEITGEGSLNAELVDTDLDDTLYVRIFVDYQVDNPTPARATCTAPPTGRALRTVTCDVGALCSPPADPEATRKMSVRVFDREPLESGDPMFQALPPGGLATGWFFLLQCT